MHLWNVRTGKLERTLGSPASPADHVAISPDGRWLVAGHKADATRRLWELRGPQEMVRPRSARVSDPAETADRRSPSDQETFGQPGGSVGRPTTAPALPIWQVTAPPCNRLLFSPDSSLVVAVSYDRDEVAIFAAANGQPDQPIPAKQCRAATFSPDGRWLAFTVQDSVVLWDWPQRRQDRVLSGHTSTVTAAAFSPDSNWVATADSDRRIKLWNPATGQLLHTMIGNTGGFRDIAFVNNDRLISADDLGNLHVWHVSLGELLCALPSFSHDPAHHMAVSNDGRYLALPRDDGKVELLDIAGR